MPIIDPSLINAFLHFSDASSKRSSRAFFIKHLKIASSNINRNIDTIKAHTLFRNDLLKNIRAINIMFKCNIPINENIYYRNYYQFLYDYLSKKNYKEKNPKLEENYILFNQKRHLLYCQISGLPYLGYWYFTDSSLAIFACNKEISLDFDQFKQLLVILNLEIDLMLASGLTLVLILDSYATNPELINYFIQNTLKDHPISEIHFILNIRNKSYKNKTAFEEELKLLLQISDSIKGYFYLYIPMISYDQINDQILQLKEKPFFQVICLTTDFEKTFRCHNDKDTTPFPYYSNGFSFDKIRICLSDILLYDTEDEQSDFAFSAVSDISYGFIKADDFLNFNKKRVQIFFEDDTIKYCDFDDLHKIKPEIHVKNIFNLTEINRYDMSKVHSIIHDANLGDVGEFQRKKIIVFDDEKKITKLLTYITRAFCEMTKDSKYIKLRPNQVLAALKACSLFLKNNNATNKETKGYVYQVHTGEGKSYIIQTIAATLALMGKTVHIATSNIFLAIRDYHDSYEFFNNLGLKSCVLLHKSEMPKFTTNENDNNNNENYDENEDEDKDLHYKKERFPSTFFGDELFENSSGMNIDVCGAGIGKGNRKQAANIIYSTFINFEAFFLRLMEMNPTLLSTYFQNCALLIDEADSILIDELTNGTILSRPMNTNGKEILVYVYQCKMKNMPPIEVLKTIKTIWPKCTDINEDDIKTMYKEIDLVNTMDFIDGKKYCVESMKIDHSKKENVIKKVLNKIDSVKKKVEEYKEIVYDAPINSIKESIKQSFGKIIKKRRLSRTKTQPKIDSDEPQLVEKTQSQPVIEPVFHYGRDEEEKRKHKKVKVNHIVPFDYDHKGILEPNKEFNGFIQQFIAIKEMLSKPDEFKHMFIKDVSMSYLYVSHPIFVQHYGGVCGLTGTIGGSYEKNIYSEQYKLDTLEIPRNNPNRRIDMPITLCRNIKERNKIIAEEAIQFSNRGYPVLIIFLDLNELLGFHKVLKRRGIDNINVFDGKDQSIKPDFIAGRKGAISLGTNVCGRGTDIKNPVKPLHVIISYFTSNVRVMQQAYGRTGRKGAQGTVHIICPKKQFYEPIEIVKDNNLNHVLADFNYKNELQKDFINSFKKNREWIFTPITKSQKLDSKSISELRNARINVNRIIAYKFKFPLCLSIDTFLMIQAQKIFSIFNCPNCMYTWQLFQRYIREMIFESWSLFIEQTERHFYNEENINKKEQYMKEQYQLLMEKLGNYIPSDSNFTIVETYMYIYKKVVLDWQDKIYKIIPKNLSCIPFKQTNTNRFISFNIGFRPFNLINGSGARISDESDTLKESDFISDPELSYMRKGQKGHFIKVSITEAIDQIFNKVCTLFNDLIGAYIGVKLFLRRTLGGCEFGLCFVLETKNDDNEVIYENCLIDRDPLLVFTISIKSVAPLLAGILIFGLVYLSSVAATISEFVTAFPQQIGITVIKKTIKSVLCELVSSNLSDFLEHICDEVIDFLYTKLLGLIDKIYLFDINISNILKSISNIISVIEFSKTGETINDLFNNNVHFSLNSQLMDSLIKDKLPVAHLVKIGITLILCLAAFLINFSNHKKSLTQSKEEKNAAEFNKDHSNLEKVDELVARNETAYNEKDHIIVDQKIIDEMKSKMKSKPDQKT